MSPRPLPRIDERPLLATAVLEPSGAHRLQVFTPRLGCDIAFTRDEVDQLAEKIASFKRLVMFEDGRTVERQHKYAEEL